MEFTFNLSNNRSRPVLDKSVKDIRIIALVLNDLLDFAFLILIKFINTNKQWNAIV